MLHASDKKSVVFGCARVVWGWVTGWLCEERRKGCIWMLDDCVEFLGVRVDKVMWVGW